MFFQICVIFMGLQHITDGISLDLPSIGNCNDTVWITCHLQKETCSKWRLRKNLADVVSPNTKRDSKYSYIGPQNHELKFELKDMQPTDAAEYKCDCDFAESKPRKLEYECKPKHVTEHIKESKHLSLFLDRVYPSAKQMSVEIGNISVPGNFTCNGSSTLDTHYKCTWTSYSSLEDVDGKVRLTVKTRTNTTLHRDIKIVTPDAPVIKYQGKMVNKIRVAEDEIVIVECSSHGGIPSPKVDWYKDITNASLLASTKTGKQQSDGTYTVTLTLTFNAVNSWDDSTFICHSYYPHATSNVTLGSRKASLQLYIGLLPSKPKIVQTNTPGSAGTVELECTAEANGSKPNITWTYKGQTFSTKMQTSQASAVGKIRVVSKLKKNVTVADNGELVTCRSYYSNPKLKVNVSDYSIGIDVKFPVSPASTVITGNRQIEATGSNPLDLNCTTGSSNPASTITWWNGSAVIQNRNPVHRWVGKNRGVVSSQILTLKPAPEHDGDVITCSVTNSDSGKATSQGEAVTEVTLNLTYAPKIQRVPSIAIDEHVASFVLFCIVSSKPLPSVTWYRDETVLATGQGIPSDDGYSSFNYTLTTVSKNDNGTYWCKADTQFGSAASKNLTVTMRFDASPNSTVITGNRQIVATGTNALNLNCTTGSSNPASTITWWNGTSVIPNRNNMVSWIGDNEGVVSSQILDLTPTRENDGDVITCSVTNREGDAAYIAGGIFNDSVTLNLTYSPMIQPMSDITVEEGQDDVVLSCIVSSKPVSTITWFRSGLVLAQGQGTTTGDGYNNFNYNLTTVSRDDQGAYICNADNKIDTADKSRLTLIVRFEASPNSTVITGNRQIAATGTNALNLNCTTGSSIPASTITWWNGTSVIPNRNTVVSWIGDNEGVVSSQILDLTPMRENDGDVITCSVTNREGDTAYKEGGIFNNSVTLNLTYSPMIQPMTSITVEEGQVDVVLSCLVSSKPVSTITWFRSGSVIAQGQGIATGYGYNSFSYTLTTVSKNHQGAYRCHADNDIVPSDDEIVSLIVQSSSVVPLELLIGGIGGGIALIVVIVVIVLMIKKKSKRKGLTSNQEQMRRTDERNDVRDENIQRRIEIDSGHYYATCEDVEEMTRHYYSVDYSGSSFGKEGIPGPLPDTFNRPALNVIIGESRKEHDDTAGDYTSKASETKEAIGNQEMIKHEGLEGVEDRKESSTTLQKTKILHDFEKCQGAKKEQTDSAQETSKYEDLKGIEDRKKTYASLQKNSTLGPSEKYHGADQEQIDRSGNEDKPYYDDAFSGPVPDKSNRENVKEKTYYNDAVSGPISDSESLNTTQKPSKYEDLKGIVDRKETYTSLQKTNPLYDSGKCQGAVHEKTDSNQGTSRYEDLKGIADRKEAYTSLQMANTLHDSEKCQGAEHEQTDSTQRTSKYEDIKDTEDRKETYTSLQKTDAPHDSEKCKGADNEETGSSGKEDKPYYDDAFSGPVPHKIKR